MIVNKKLERGGKFRIGVEKPKTLSLTCVVVRI
jgi:hypothetical protein